MEHEQNVYVPFRAGDLITAETGNKVQSMIKDDIRAKIEKATSEIKESGVSRADNADRFDNMTPKNLTDKLDARYAPRVHDHEGMAGYRRYYKRLRPGDTVVLEHELGRFPLVDVYQLLPIAPNLAPNPIMEKFYLHYHHEERDRDVLFTEDRGVVRSPWGTPLEQLLSEYDVEWEDDDSLNDVYNDFLDAFFKPPEIDYMEHKTSPWIDAHREGTIEQLKRRDEWPDIRWVVRPHRVLVGTPLLLSERDEAADQPGPVVAPPMVDIFHVGYDDLALIAAETFGVGPDGNATEALDLMILLRS